MGYRRLLKDYVQLIDDLLGIDSVELAAATERLSGRDIGELRTIVAELVRGRAAVDTGPLLADSRTSELRKRLILAVCDRSVSSADLLEELLVLRQGDSEIDAETLRRVLSVLLATSPRRGRRR